MTTKYITSNTTFLHPRAPIGKPDEVPTRYAVIVDAGSSGSRVQVFSWKDSVSLRNEISSLNSTALNSVPEVIQDTKYNKKISPGLSSFAGKAENLWIDHLLPLIVHAETGVPEADRPYTPIFLLATAGMRLLPEEDQKEILSTSCELLRERSNFYLPDCDSHVTIIDGETEALYGWLALNYLLKTFNSYTGLPKSISPILENEETIEHQKSFGFMDMGGASMQIAFSPNSTETEKHLNDLYHIKLRSLNGENQEWKVFVSTWLGYGANEARRRYAKHLLDTGNGDVDSMYSSGGFFPHDPCFPLGLTHEMKIDANTTMAFQGSGNFTECLQSMQPLLQKDLPCPDNPCLFGGVHAPGIDFQLDRFVGVSEYWYTASDVFKLGGHYSFDTFSNHVEHFCGLPWEKIKEETARGGEFEGISEDKLKTACFKATWVLNVLHSGFGLPINEAGDLIQISPEEDEKEEEQPDIKELLASRLHGRSLADFNGPFQSASNIEGVELTWMLGRALLYASSQIPAISSTISDVGFRPADTSTKHYVLGGEISGIKPPEIVYKPTENATSAESIKSGSSYGISQFLGSVILLSLLGYLILHFFNTLRLKRHFSWIPTGKLRLLSLPKLAGRRFFSMRRGLFGDGSAGYQRVLEEGGMEFPRVSLSGLSGSEAGQSNISLATASPEHSPPQKHSKLGIPNASYTSMSTTSLNKVFTEKMGNPFGGSHNTGLGPGFGSEVNIQQKLNIPVLASSGRSTSMIDLSQFQNTIPRPPSRPSSRMSLYNMPPGYNTSNSNIIGTSGNGSNVNLTGNDGNINNMNHIHLTHNNGGSPPRNSKSYLSPKLEPTTNIMNNRK